MVCNRAQLLLREPVRVLQPRGQVGVVLGVPARRFVTAIRYDGHTFFLWKMSCLAWILCFFGLCMGKIGVCGDKTET